MPLTLSLSPEYRGEGTKQVLFCGRLLVAATLLLAPNLLLAQEPTTPNDDAPAAAADANQDVSVRSLPLRTSLHHDATLEAPLDRLVAMYREAGRLSELVELYRTHVASYPNDPSGAAVYVRLLDAAGDSQAGAIAKSQAETHPQNAYLQYLWYQAQRRTRRNDALPTLERAIALSTSFRQKSAWIETLLTEATTAERPELVDKYLGEMATAATTADAKLEVARRMANFGRHTPALQVLEQAATLNPAPEAGVQIETTAATVEIALDKHAEAAARLDRLLEKLAPDYWGRAELVRRRMSLVTADDERTKMIDAAKKRAADRPTDEAAAADLAQLLVSFEHRREALAALLEAGRKIPQSERLEKMTLELLDRLRDEPARRTYLAERVKALPERFDLLTLHIRALLSAGERTAAQEALDRLVATTPADRRETVQIELARSLNRANLPADAAEVFERVIKASPARFDLRRELAEAYIKLGNRSRARELFAVDLPDDVAIEAVMDFVPFLISHEMFVEARKALKKAIKPDDADLDLRLMAVDVERRIGNRTAAAKLLVEARPLADTPTRYKAWIEAAATLHEEDETLAAFVADEQKRLTDEGGAWTETRAERVAALLEVAGREKAKANLEEFVAEYLNDEAIPATARRAIRRQLVRMLKPSGEATDTLAGQLQDLIDELPDDADEYKARLALLYLKSNQHHLVGPLLNEVRVARLSDVQLLSELETAFAQMSQPQQVAEVLERLTTLEPANKGHWEAWLYHAAVTGREDRLRDSLRRLQAGVDALPLEEPVKELLRTAELDSYGRSILANLSDGRTAPLADALALVDSAERKSATPQQALWLSWNRAFILNRLKRPADRDEAIGEMERVLREISAATPTAQGKPDAKSQATGAAASEEKAKPEGLVTAFNVDAQDALRLRFADGLSLSLESARRLLTSPPREPLWPKADDRRGPLPQLSTEWALDLPSGRSVESLHLLSPGRLVIVDATGSLIGVDAVTGKLLWEREGMMPRVGGEMHMSMTRTVNGQQTSQNARVVAPAPLPVHDDAHRLFFAHAGEVTCISGHDGAILWRSTLSAKAGTSPSAAGPRVLNFVFLHGDEVLAFDPETDTVATFDRATGKLRWSYEIDQGEPLEATRQLNFLNTGASYDGERLFVYGRRAAMIDVSLRDVQWTIDAERAEKVPLKLDTPTPVSMMPSPAVASLRLSPAYGNTYYGGVGSYYAPSPYGSVPYGSVYPTTYYAPPSTTSRGSPVVSVGNSRYVDYQRRGETGTSSTPRTPVDTTLVGPAALWSTASLSGQPRFAILNDNKLVLGSSDSSTIMDTDFPIAGRRVSTVGTYLGRVGHILCSLRGNELAAIDLSTGRRGGARLTDITGGEYNARTQAALDGPLAYVTGPNGILCTNVLSKKRVFTVAWPAGALLDADDPRVPFEAAGVDTGTHFLWHGLAVPAGQTWRSVSPAAAVSRGKLFTAATPWRVVCIAGLDQP